MAEENQVKLQQITQVIKEPQQIMKEPKQNYKRTATSNYKEPKESRSW